MILCKIHTVTFDELSQMGVVILDVGENKILPIWVGLFEAQAILIKLQNTNFPRPLTHDLLKNFFDILNAKLEYIIINGISNNTFYAQLHILFNKKKYIVDCRPSDAIAIAVRTNSNIYIEEKVVEIAAVNKDEFNREQKEKLYSAFLKSIPDELLKKQ